MKMTIGFVVMAMGSTTIDIPIKEFKALMDGHKAVEIFCMKIEDVQSICGLIAAWASTVIMFFQLVQAQFIGAGITLIKPLESINHGGVFTRSVQHFGFSKLDLRNDRDGISRVLRGATSLSRCILGGLRG